MMMMLGKELRGIWLDSESGLKYFLFHFTFYSRSVSPFVSPLHTGDMAGSLLAFGLLQDLDAVRSQTASLLLCDLGLLLEELWFPHSAVLVLPSQTWVW